MLKRLVLLASVAAFPLSGALAEPAADAARMFGARESIRNMSVSADGTRLVYVAAVKGAVSAAMVVEVATGKSQALITSSGKPEKLQWCSFAGNSQVVCEIDGSTVNGDGILVGWSRLVAVGLDGSKARMLGQRASFYDARARQFDGAILDWLPEEDGAVLMSRDYVPEEGKTGSIIVRQEDGLGVDRIDLRTLKSSRVERPSRAADEYISDGHGHVRIMSLKDADQSGTLSGRYTYMYRRKGESGWQKFSAVSGDDDALVPIAVDAATDTAYALKKLNGRQALYRVKLDGSLSTELAFAHDKFDVDEAVSLGGRIIGASYVDDQRKVVYFDPEYQKLALGLSKAIPNLPLIQFVSASADGGKVVLLAASDTDPGRYYLFDKKTKQLGELFPLRPELAGTKLAQVKPVTYAVGDVTVPAYLTLPPGKDPKNLPAIVLPHGGPTARDEWGFEWLAQFFANQGYAVLQPNYRGSSGYGDPWYNKNGFQGWKTSIGDVTAGAKWLIQSGIADPKHVSMVGWSYGGYAALQSAVVEPSLFRAVVAVAPVTDFALLKSEAEPFDSSKLVAAQIGSGPHIREGSPLQNVDRISVPVLIFSGDHDLNVNVEQSRKMDKALRGAGKASEFVLFPDLDHQLDDSDARTQMLAKIAAFLEAHGAK